MGEFDHLLQIACNCVIQDVMCALFQDQFPPAFSAGGADDGQAGSARGSTAQLWYVDATGKPAVMRVRTGLSDGQNTEVMGPNVREGMQVIIGTATTTTTPTTSPFQQQRRGPGGF